jgi:hypothetical protein
VGDGRNAVILTPKGDTRPYAMQPGPFQLQPVPPETVPALIRKQAAAQTQTAHRMFYARQYHEMSERP